MSKDSDLLLAEILEGLQKQCTTLGDAQEAIHALITIQQLQIENLEKRLKTLEDTINPSFFGDH